MKYLIFSALLFLPNVALAEGLAEANLATWLVTLILIAMMVIGRYIWKHYIVVYLQTKEIQLDAETIVRAVEAIVGRGNGEKKWAMAVAKMAELGWNVDTDAVEYALKAAWSLLNISMVASGEKSADVYTGTVYRDTSEPEVHED